MSESPWFWAEVDTYERNLVVMAEVGIYGQSLNYERKLILMSGNWLVWTEFGYDLSMEFAAMRKLVFMGGNWCLLGKFVFIDKMW